MVISDGGVTNGIDDIVANLAGFGAFFGGQVPTVNQEIVVSILDNRTHMVRTLFSITTPCVDINDGTDTYIIRDGRIQAQTAHGFPTFKCGRLPAHDASGKAVAKGVEVPLASTFAGNRPNGQCLMGG